MEKRHVHALRRRHGDALEGRRLLCLHIPDEYDYMDPSLVERLRRVMAPHLPAAAADAEEDGDAE